MTRSVGLILMLAVNLMAVEVTGKWEGFLRPASGDPVPVSLSLEMKGGEVSGSVAFSSNPAKPIEGAILSGDQLTFRAVDSFNHTVAFDLRVTYRSMSGEAVSAGQRLQVSLSPAVQPGVSRVGPGVSAPTLIFKTEPQYTEQARNARLQGTVLLYTEISPEGKAINMRVLHGLGLGLDEKAIEAVSQWHFRPGMKDGHPVTVQAQIEVNFRLLDK